MSDDRETTNAPEEGAHAPREAGVRPLGYERADGAARKRSRALRLTVLVAGLAIITALGYIHQVGAPFKIVGVDALCPFGGIETLWSLVAGGTLLQKVATSSIVLLVITVITALVLRRSFCGYICPLGALQELFGKIGKAIWRNRRPAVPAAIDRPARYLKYIVFAVFTLWTWQAAELVIRPYDPWVTYMHLTSAEVFTEFSIGFAVLAVSLVGSIVYERFFCKYLCPMGAFLGVVSKLSLFKVRRDTDTCIDCKACDRACPVNVKVSEAAPAVTSAECINCNECVNACPVKGALEVSAKGPEGGRKVLSPNRVLAVMGGLIGGVLVVTTATGLFSWLQPGLAPATTAPASEVRPATGAAVPNVNVEDIKGSMTLDEVIAATTIPASAFQEKWGIQASETGEKLKDLGSKYGFDIHTDFRDFVAVKLEAMRSATSTGGSTP